MSTQTNHRRSASEHGIHDKYVKNIIANFHPTTADAHRVKPRRIPNVYPQGES